ncbi:hypothetical protein RHMOL_Rhmol13G0228900 [Rhododendron molle]|uniref:Uncharacterized protein n=1 Tax=Rhododendron molle TaxID=49168 RepID=A0ACC0LAQ4_RHOML|nr:hypothetical protein RHMOL_Rhmol13G0228900 [Rhododendron molle]
MAISSTWVLSLKLLFISAGVASVAFLMNLSVPLITHFVLHQIPLIWSTFVSLLRPPYIYFVVNGIIITIAATSRFHHLKPDGSTQSEPSAVESKPPPSDLVHSGYSAVSTPLEFGVGESPAVYEDEVVEKTVVLNGDGPAGEDAAWTPPQRSILAEAEQPECVLASPGKPLVSSRFGHRKPLKASPEGGRSLRVAKPKRQETLETTWKAITDGRHVPLTRHLRKSETWENHGRQFNTTADHSPPPQIVLKSETLRDRTNYNPQPANPSPGSSKLRKEASLSQDELNRRVEAFIKKFNDEMRLQRQESMNQYMEMINRGAH